MRAVRPDPRRAAWAIALALATAGPVAAAPAEPPAGPAPRLTIDAVAPGVWVAQPADRRRFDECTATVIEAGEGLIVVDTFGEPRAARELLAALGGLSPHPVRWIVNTHGHGDHVAGNAVLLERFPDAAIVAHGAARADVLGRAAAQLDEERASAPGHLAQALEMRRTGRGPDGRPADAAMRERIERTVRHFEDRIAALAEIRLAPPTVLVADSLTLHGGSRVVRLVHFPGHTGGDLIVEVPDAGVLVTGDLLDDMPFTGHGSPRALVATLRAFEAMPFTVQVPGHGPPRRDRAHLSAVRALFEAVVAAAEAARAADEPLERLRERFDGAPFRDRIAGDDPVHRRHFDAFLGDALERAHAEAGREATP